MASTQTTFMGAIVSQKTLPSDGTTGILMHVPSGGILDTASGKHKSRQTSASLTSVTLADGEFAVGAVSATSAILYFRSGNTTYRWLANSAAVL